MLYIKAIYIKGLYSTIETKFIFILKNCKHLGWKYVDFLIELHEKNIGGPETTVSGRLQGIRSF